MSHTDDIPEPDGSDAKEVYAFYGLAAYMAQVVEKALVTLLAIVETNGVRTTRADYEAVFSQLDSRTFGQLLRRLARMLPISAEIEALLLEALQRRNYLAHHFFADRAAAFMVNHGRVQMIAELRAYTELFHRAEDQIGLLRDPVMKKRGMTREAVERYAEAMVAAFLAEPEGAHGE